VLGCSRAAARLVGAGRKPRRRQRRAQQAVRGAVTNCGTAPSEPLQA
jgi:hypothetical protein